MSRNTQDKPRFFEPLSGNQTNISTVDISRESYWDRLENYFRTSFGKTAYDQWLRHVNFIDIDGYTILLSVPTPFIRDIVLNNYFKQIWGFVQSNLSPLKIIEIRVVTNLNPETPTIPYNETKEGILPGMNTEQLASNLVQQSPLSEKLTFSDFVVGPSNRIAYFSAFKVALHVSSANAKNINIDPKLEGDYAIAQHLGLFDSSSCQQNNLYIHGNVGIGKTHLLQAIAHYIRKNFTSCQLMYLTAERFTQAYVKAVRTNSLFEFKEQMSNVELLLLDDIQFLCGRQSTEREFSNVLDLMSEMGRPVIVTCDRPPAELTLEARTRSRLANGLAVKIHEPDFELRLKILEQKGSAIAGMNEYAPTAFRTLADRVSSNVRELEGALAKVAAHWQILGGKVDMASLINDIVEPSTNRSVKSATTGINSLISHDTTVIMEQTANYYRVTTEDMKSKKRNAPVSLARQIFVHLSRKFTDISLKDLGQRLGNRHHATIIYLQKSAAKKIKNDAALASSVEHLWQQLQKN